MKRVRIPTPKVIADPVYGIFDIRPVLPMVEREEFQALGDKRQLGMSYLTFPSATHSRKAHALGSYHATRELADRWIKLRLINEKQGSALAGYALYHDIGHPAFSHVTEDLCRLDNNGLSLEIIRRSRKEIEASGIDFNLMERLSSYKDPLHLAVKDKNLGMEKLDYLERDGLYTILSRPSGVEYLRNHIYFIDGKLAIDEKAVDIAIEVQNFYLKMYKNVYLRKSSVIAQRMLQKMVYRMIIAQEITADDLVRITDSELIGILSVSKDFVAQKLYGFLRTRDLFREAVVIRHRSFAKEMSGGNKAVAELGVDEEIMRKLIKSPHLQNKNQASLEILERRIAEIAGLPEEVVLAVPVFYPWRFESQDVLIYKENGGFDSLKQRYPAHFKSMEETGAAYVAFRICTTEQYRRRMSSPKIGRRVFSLVMGSVS